MTRWWFCLRNLLVCLVGTTSAFAADVATIKPSDLAEFDQQPKPVRELIERALKLTRMDLGYKYGSADPKNGGMDCSGTVAYLLKSDGFEHVPRQANQMYVWAWKHDGITPVVSSDLKSFQFSRIKPGDLMFWSGTYSVKREPPVTHVMLYLGRLKKDGRRVMFGASDGRRFNRKSMSGVSVFDLELPRQGSKSRFLGYAPIPGMRQRIEEAVHATVQVAQPVQQAPSGEASAPPAQVAN